MFKIKIIHVKLPCLTFLEYRTGGNLTFLFFSVITCAVMIVIWQALCVFLLTNTLSQAARKRKIVISSSVERHVIHRNFITLIVGIPHCLRCDEHKRRCELFLAFGWCCPTLSFTDCKRVRDPVNSTRRTQEKPPLGRIPLPRILAINLRRSSTPLQFCVCVFFLSFFSR
jgi:hypothetical protein